MNAMSDDVHEEPIHPIQILEQTTKRLRPGLKNVMKELWDINNSLERQTLSDIWKTPVCEPSGITFGVADH